ncbi:hypothetical protein BDP27DRAFT_1425213 [Rhodocollybia butyracea]|uniref:Uncharacterized protein n=1 Tax=Rhodocollybia butyracea TaxID=206335 RepID=A0A9P5PKG8_9AGAR|nr:hypothetical protein BDP27DRAFT_1425213 [Rhodocollybia butyracea]
MQFFTSLISLLAVATTSVLAQSAKTGAPPNATEVAAGSNFTMMVERPDTSIGSREISLVIGLASCANCPGPSKELGTTLYNGGFDPKFTSKPGTTTLPPHQNFTLTVPSTFPQGPAQLGVAHFALVGASTQPFFETFSTTLIIT